MQLLRGTKDILPKEIILWQYIYNKIHEILTLSNYQEIRTPILETTDLFQRSIGNDTDIINKEMYSFIDQGNRPITLRPEGTASIARAFIHHKLYNEKNITRLWYLGPMFRYERPQNGRQRQFHQLGIECIGSLNAIADAEVIRLADQVLKILKCRQYNIQINSIGTFEERDQYKQYLVEYLSKHYNDLDQDSQKRLINNPLRILDSKNTKTREIIKNAPKLKEWLKKNSLEHFEQVCQFLQQLNIEYTINDNLVRGLDYYNNTAFEITTNVSKSMETICGGGRYDTLIKQLGGPDTPSVGWAIGIERLLILAKESLQLQTQSIDIYIAVIGIQAQMKAWEIIPYLEEYKIRFELDLSNDNLKKQLRNANKLGASLCLIIGEEEIYENYISLKNLKTGQQTKIVNNELINIISFIKEN